jgi:hypothetical protein
MLAANVIEKKEKGYLALRIKVNNNTANNNRNSRNATYSNQIKE